MAEWAVGLSVVVVVLGLAAAVAITSRRTSSFHPRIDIEGLGLPPGLVVFTSTACVNCKDVLQVARSIDVPLREVTYEIEAELQEQAGVTGVPLTIVVDRTGAAVSQFAGKVSERSLRRAVVNAGF